MGLEQSREEDKGSQTVQKQKQGTRRQHQSYKKKNLYNCSIHQRPGGSVKNTCKNMAFKYSSKEAKPSKTS